MVNEMFVSFSVKNIGPFKQETGITTSVETAKKEYWEENTFELAGNNYNKITYIYGANGSGKTNYFVALTKLQKTVIMSTVLGVNNNKLLEVPAIKKELSAPIETFKFDDMSKSKETEFKVELVIDGILYTYSFAILDGKIQNEFLSKKNKRTEILLKRTSPKFEDILLKSDLLGFKPTISVVREDALCLAMAAMLNNTLADKIVNEIMNFRIINMSAFGGTPVFDDENTDDETIKRYLKFLKVADPTLTNLKVDVESKADQHPISDDDFENKKFIVKNIKVSVSSAHAVFHEHKRADEIELPFLKYESNGTVRLLGVLPAIFKALDTGNALFIDEIENGLHPNLVKLIIGLFNSKETNPLNSQLICTTHNTLLLENVRRDQVWFADKNEFGESKLHRLSEFPNVRNNDNIEAKYLQGVFGAVPNLQGFE